MLQEEVVDEGGGPDVGVYTHAKPDHDRAARRFKRIGPTLRRKHRQNREKGETRFVAIEQRDTWADRGDFAGQRNVLAAV